MGRAIIGTIGPETGVCGHLGVIPKLKVPRTYSYPSDPYPQREHEPMNGIPWPLRAKPRIRSQFRAESQSPRSEPVVAERDGRTPRSPRKPRPVPLQPTAPPTRGATATADRRPHGDPPRHCGGAHGRVLLPVATTVLMSTADRRPQPAVPWRGPSRCSSPSHVLNVDSIRKPRFPADG